MLWEELTYEQFDDAIKRSKGLCVLPIGCIEKHGQHGPVGTDYYRAKVFSEEAAKIEDAVVFPTGAWFGDVTGYHAKKEPGNNRGGIGMKLETITRLLEELCDEIARNGFTKILLFHSHGGNLAWLQNFVRLQEKKRKPYATFYAWANNNAMNQPAPFLKAVTERRDEFPMITDEDIEAMKGWLKTGYQGGHANFIETAEVMGYKPELIDVDMYDAEYGLSLHRTDYLKELGIELWNDWNCNYPNSYSGASPHGCTESIGKAMIKISTERAVRVYKKIKENDISLEASRMLTW